MNEIYLHEIWVIDGTIRQLVKVAAWDYDEQYCMSDQLYAQMVGLV